MKARFFSLLLLLVLLGGVAFAQQSVSPEPAKAGPTPAITLQQLETRLTELEHGKEQAVANVNAYVGAIQECQHWIDEAKAQAAKSEETKSPPKPSH